MLIRFSGTLVTLFESRFSPLGSVLSSNNSLIVFLSRSYLRLSRVGGTLVLSDWSIDQSLAREHRYRHVLFYGSTCWLAAKDISGQSLFNWKHFPVSMEYAGFFCPTYCFPPANHWLLPEGNGERDVSPPIIGWSHLHFTSTLSNYMLRCFAVILRQIYPVSLVRLGWAQNDTPGIQGFSLLTPSIFLAE